MSLRNKTFSLNDISLFKNANKIFQEITTTLESYEERIINNLSYYQTCIIVVFWCTTEIFYNFNRVEGIY